MYKQNCHGSAFRNNEKRRAQLVMNWVALFFITFSSIAHTAFAQGPSMRPLPPRQPVNQYAPANQYQPANQYGPAPMQVSAPPAQSYQTTVVSTTGTRCPATTGCDSDSGCACTQCGTTDSDGAGYRADYPASRCRLRSVPLPASSTRWKSSFVAAS